MKSGKRGTTVEPSRQGTGTPPEPAPAMTAHEPYGEIVAAARMAPSRSRFMGVALRCMAKSFVSPYAAIHVRYSSEVVQDDCHFGRTDPNFWKANLQHYLTESLAESRARAKLLKSKNGSTKIAFLSAPIFDSSGPAIGAVAMVVMNVEACDLIPRLTKLEALCRVASLSAEMTGRSASGAPAGGVSDRGLAKAAQCESATQLAFAITNELRNKLGCEQVALGMVNRSTVRILCVSGLDHLPRQSPGMTALRRAMEECLDAGESIFHPAPADWSDRNAGPAYFLHRCWHAVTHGAAVASIPLRSGETTGAILSLRHRSDQPFTQERVDDIRRRIEPLVPALILADKAHRSVTRHAWESARSYVADTLSPGRRARKITIALLAMGAAWFAFGTLGYEVAVRCVVAPAEARQLSAPFEGILAEVRAVAGDRVEAGQVLCRLDDRELRSEEAQLGAEWTVWERKYDQAMAENSRVDAQLALAQQELIRVKRDLVRSRIERAGVAAPFAGIVVSGDLRTRVGGVLTQGEPLMAVAALNRWKLELEVPEHASDEIAPKLSGRFASHAQPEHRHSFVLSRVLPGVVPRDQQNVALAEAEIESGGAELRPGMEGVARIAVGNRPVWWVTLHQVLDYVRMKIWW